MNIIGKKRAVESFVVAKRGQTVYTADTTINSATGNVVLNDGQLGIFSEKGSRRGRSLTNANITLANAAELAIYQGTSESANVGGSTQPSPLWVRPYEKSATITGTQGNISAYKQPYTPGSFSVWTVSNITPVPATTFGLHVGFRGRSIQNYFGAQEALSMTPQYVTSAFDPNAPAAVDAARNEIINYLTYDILRNSAALSLSERNRGGSYPLMAFAVDTTAASAGTVISAIVAGTPFQVATTVSGLSRTVTLTQAQVDSVLAACAAAAIPLTSTIVPASLTAPQLTDAMILVAMDRVPALKDYEVLDKISLEVGLIYGFNTSTTSLINGSFARETQGSGKQLFMNYKFTQGQRKYNLITIDDPIVEFPNPFDVTESYDLIQLVHSKGSMVDSVNKDFAPFIEYLAIPTAVKGVAGVAAQFTTLETALNTWLTNTGNGIIID